MPTVSPSDIALRAIGKYKMTATDEKLRAAEQFSMQWLTAEEEHQYSQAMALISRAASKIDNTFSPEPKPRWNDHGFAYAFRGSPIGQRAALPALKPDVY